ncbi:MAG TPA: hypothetical protein PKH68_05400, partial [Paludibacteraceae bacterium]|nr:hypothetical protein [Paludibacteraceae bacterium]
MNKINKDKDRDKTNSGVIQTPGESSPFRGLGGFFLLKTAIKSLLGNGLKTWLNVFVLSISFVLIIFMQG